MKFVDRVHSRRGSYLTEREYAERTDNELRYFDERVTVHDLPPIYHYWSNTYLRPKLQHFGYEHPLHFFQTEAERACRRLQPGVCRIVSLGSGNCDLEVGLVVGLLEAGSANFVFECVDINPTMLERGQQMAASQGVRENMRFVEGDLNHWRPEETVDCVIANQVLHHVVELEDLFAAIRNALNAQASLLVSDMIGRNGHLRWPEALVLVEQFWSQLPSNKRRNFIFDREVGEFEDWDCSVDSFEGIRAQDILPLLIENFGFEFFLGFANIVTPFIDRCYGPNFDPTDPTDLAFIDRVHETDEENILQGQIKPTQMLAVLRREDAGQLRLWRDMSPQLSVRAVG